MTAPHIKSPYGAGWSHPVRPDTAGRVATSAGLRKVREALEILIRTEPGTRVMRPAYGCPLRALVFGPNSRATADLARHHVAAAIARWEPRVEITDLVVTNDGRGDALSISLQYRLASTLQTDLLELRLPLQT